MDPFSWVVQEAYRLFLTYNGPINAENKYERHVFFSKTRSRTLVVYLRLSFGKQTRARTAWNSKRNDIKNIVFQWLFIHIHIYGCWQHNKIFRVCFHFFSFSLLLWLRCWFPIDFADMTDTHMIYIQFHRFFSSFDMPLLSMLVCSSKSIDMRECINRLVWSIKINLRKREMIIEAVYWIDFAGKFFEWDQMEMAQFHIYIIFKGQERKSIRKKNVNTIFTATRSMRQLVWCSGTVVRVCTLSSMFRVIWQKDFMGICVNMSTYM